MRRKGCSLTVDAESLEKKDSLKENAELDAHVARFVDVCSVFYQCLSTCFSFVVGRVAPSFRSMTCSSFIHRNSSLPSWEGAKPNPWRVTTFLLFVAATHTPPSPPPTCPAFDAKAREAGERRGIPVAPSPLDGTPWGREEEDQEGRRRFLPIRRRRGRRSRRTRPYRPVPPSGGSLPHPVPVQ